MVKVKWIGNAFFMIQSDDKLLFVDPWFNEDQNVAVTKAEAIAMKPDYVFVTHGHPGHYGRGDSVEIANTVGCPFISTIEVVGYALAEGGLKAPYIGMSPGSKIFIDGISVEMYKAKHPPIYIPPEWLDLPGEPNGFFVFTVNGKTILQVGDTDHDAVFEEIAKTHEIDIALLPIKENKTDLARDNEIITLMSIINTVKPKAVFVHNRWKPGRPAYEAFAKGISSFTLESTIYPQELGAEYTL